jgi:hypothetical protein
LHPQARADGGTGLIVRLTEWKVVSIVASAAIRAANFDAIAFGKFTAELQQPGCAAMTMPRAIVWRGAGAG